MTKEKLETELPTLEVNGTKYEWTDLPASVKKLVEIHLMFEKELATEELAAYKTRAALRQIRKEIELELAEQPPITSGR